VTLYKDCVIDWNALNKGQDFLEKYADQIEKVLLKSLDPE